MAFVSQRKRLASAVLRVDAAVLRRHMKRVDSAPTPAISSDEHTRLTSRAATLSLGVAVTLIALKSWAWSASGSVAMLASLADSALDLAASIITYFAIRYAAAPPDREHRYGHGKAEAFAGLIQGGLVAVSGVLIVVESISHIARPVPISHGAENLVVIWIAAQVDVNQFGLSPSSILCR